LIEVFLQVGEKRYSADLLQTTSKGCTVTSTAAPVSLGDQCLLVVPALLFLLPVLAPDWDYLILPDYSLFSRERTPDQYVVPVRVLETLYPPPPDKREGIPDNFFPGEVTVGLLL
jgi:hypothetical protein